MKWLRFGNHKLGRSQANRVLIVFALASLVAALIPATPVLAADGIWLDAANIKVGNDVFTDNRLNDSRNYFKGGDGWILDG
jgi:hypothetical protein